MSTPSQTHPPPSFRGGNNTPSAGGATSGPALSLSSSSSTTSSPPSSPSDQSVKLMSLSSSDSRSVHSVTFNAASGSCFIESQSLPLAGTFQGDIAVDTSSDSTTDNTTRPPSTVRTPLPDKVRRALMRYPPKELVCLGGSSIISTNNKTTTLNIPPLCLYTAKDVFILHLEYHGSSAGNAVTGEEIVEGSCVRVDEPYEEYLMGRSAFQIIRIRPAPHQSNGYSNIMCPSTAISMLIVDANTSEYSLCLFHGIDGRATTSSVGSSGSSGRYGLFDEDSISVGAGNITEKFFAMEDLDDPNHKIVDFCFCQSGNSTESGRSNLQLLSYLTVALLKSNGVVLHVGPVLFRKTVVPAGVLSETFEFLEAAMHDSPPSSARRRQCMTARTYLIEAFPDASSVNSSSGDISMRFVTAKTGRSKSYDWPLQLQGLFRSERSWEVEGIPAAAAAAIEPYNAGFLSGFAIGYGDDLVDFCVASPSTFIPRFSYESQPDSIELDDNAIWGVLVNRVDLKDDTGDADDDRPWHLIGPKVDQVQLIRDPVMDTVVHYVKPSKIVSISTTAARCAANKAAESSRQSDGIGPGRGRLFSPSSKRSDIPPRTSAWLTLDIEFFQGDANPVVGAVVCSDVKLGHALVARLADGSTLAINLTETRHRHEMNSISESEEEGIKALTNTAANDIIDPSMNLSKPLAGIIKPHMTKVLDGLSRMVKVGGTSTPKDQVTADTLAGADAIHRRCKEEVFVPVQEMNLEVKVRQKELVKACESYAKQLEGLKAMITKLTARQQELREKASIVTENANSLASQCSMVLQASNDLLPTLTQAEYDYFNELKRMDEKTKDYVTEIEILKVKSQSLTERTESQHQGVDPIKGERQMADNATQVLRGTEILLDKNKSSLKTLRQTLDGLL